MGTVIAGTLAVLPYADQHIEDSVENLRLWLTMTAYVFVCSILYFLGTFAAAGFAWSSLVNENATMAISIGVGSIMCVSLAIPFGPRLLAFFGTLRPKKGSVYNVITQGAISIIKACLSRLGWLASSKQSNLREDEKSRKVLLSPELTELIRKQNGRGCFASSKESNSGNDKKSLKLVLRCTKLFKDQKGSKVGDDTYEVLRKELWDQLHLNSGQQSCHFRSCYRILESESKVLKREWYGKSLLPLNKAMWGAILDRLKEIGTQAADTGHFLFKDKSEGFTSSSESINHLKKIYGVNTVQKGNVSVLEILNRKAREDVEELGVHKAYGPPGMNQINDSMWEVYSPPGGPPDLEIIFFHGVQRDSDHENAFWKSWVATSDDRLVWPQVWLPTEFPTARILFASHSFIRSRFDLLDGGRDLMGENLVADIVRSRCGQNVPVFLVGHSLGGVLIKQVFISFKSRSAMNPHVIRKSFDNFLHNVKGVFFYGTPQSDNNQLAQLVSQMRHVPSLAELLEGSNFIRLNEEFRELRRIYNVRTGAVGETRPTKYRGFNGMVVPEASARGGVDQNWTNRMADHFTVCRARSATDPVVIGKLTNFIRESLE